MPKKEDPIIRFHRKYRIDPITNCWIWNNTSKDFGYGCFSYNKKSFLAHRFSYLIHNGPLDPELEICHECNNKACVNPRHLRQDTRSSNLIDASYDCNHPDQKLTPEQVKEIKIALLNPYFGIGRDLSLKYNISQGLISAIKNNRLWSHLKI